MFELLRKSHKEASSAGKNFQTAAAVVHCAKHTYRIAGQTLDEYTVKNAKGMPLYMYSKYPRAKVYTRHPARLGEHTLLRFFGRFGGLGVRRALNNKSQVQPSKTIPVREPSQLDFPHVRPSYQTTPVSNVKTVTLLPSFCPKRSLHAVGQEAPTLRSFSHEASSFGPCMQLLLRIGRTHRITTSSFPRVQFHNYTCSQKWSTEKILVLFGRQRKSSCPFDRFCFV